MWSVEDDLVVYDHLKSYMPGPKLAKSPKVAALVAKLSASADEIVARFGELVDISGPARLRLDEAVKAKARAREGAAAPRKAEEPKGGAAAKPAQAKKKTSGAGAKPKKKKARVATPAPPRREDLLDMMLDGPPDGSQVLVRWEGEPGPERDGCWRAIVYRKDGKLWLGGANFSPDFGDPMPFDPVQDSWRMAPSNVAPRATPAPRRPPPPPPRPPAPAAAAGARAHARARTPRRRPSPLSTAERWRAARHHAARTARRRRRRSRSAARPSRRWANRSEGSLDHKKAEIKDVCREEVARLKKAEESRKRQRPPDADDDVVVTGSVNAIDAVAARIADAEKDGRVIEIGDDSPKKAAAADDDARSGPPRPRLPRPSARPSAAPARARPRRAAPIPVAPPPQRWPPVPVASPAAAAAGPGRAAAARTSPGRAAARAAAGRPSVHVRGGAGGAPDGADGPQLRPRVLRLPLRPRQTGCGYFDWEDGGGASTMRAPAAPGPRRRTPRHGPRCSLKLSRPCTRAGRCRTSTTRRRWRSSSGLCAEAAWRASPKRRAQTPLCTKNDLRIPRFNAIVSRSRRRLENAPLISARQASASRCSRASSTSRLITSSSTMPSSSSDGAHATELSRARTSSTASHATAVFTASASRINASTAARASGLSTGRVSGGARSARGTSAARLARTVRVLSRLSSVR